MTTRGALGRAALSLAAAVAVVGLTGCGSSESIIGGGPVEQIWEPGMREEVTVWHTYSDVEAATFENEVIPAFEKEYPDIHVISVKKPYESFKGALISETTSGSGPDIARLDMVWMAEFAKLGLIDPVDGYPEFPRISKTLYRTALDTAKYEGRYYGVALNLNTKAAIYSRKQLADAGLSEPPKTMDELVALSERTGGELGIGGINTWSILPYFRGLGGQLTNEDYTKATGYLDSEPSVRAVETLKRLLDEGIISDDSLTGKLDRWIAVKEDKLLMIDEGPWYYTIMKNVNGMDEEALTKSTIAAPFPHNDGQRSAIIGGEDLVMMNSSHNKQAAWTFMKWMTDIEAQRTMFKTGLLPTNVEASEAEHDLGPTIEPYVESLDESFLRPPVANWGKIDDDFNTTLERIMRGRVPIRIGLEQLAERIDAYLK